ncbi:LysM peptidoglycan-binding domain-containing M23 family metallopeptidase [Pannus brasiliensis CCIBt3594]|uniref:LysM peptidoglycan-binding domain-containing M23 family metallopeptidase n=1 Tax=Pannus brasiliensis CCIBt3594 TaxID=1427578 RepID=A0AAW9QTX5_9CHRO
MKETFHDSILSVTPGRTEREQSELSPPRQGNPLVRRSAAALGLVISMGTTGMLAVRPERVHAANSLPSDGERLNIPSIERSRDNDPPSPRVILSETLTSVSIVAAAPAIEHEVKPGESLWLLARAYHTTPEAIATMNEIPELSELTIGQTLKIPTPERLNAAMPSEPSTSEQLERVSDSLHQTSKRLQDSLADSLARETESPSESSETALAPDKNDLAARDENTQRGIEIPVIPPEESPESLSRSIPIEVPAPESDRPVTAVLPRKPATAPVGETAPSSNVTPVGEAAPAATEPGYSAEVPAIPDPRAIVPSKTRYYRVRPGDTLNTIARTRGISPGELARANGILDPNRLEIDRSLIVPAPSAEPVDRENPIGTNSSPAEPPALSSSPGTVEGLSENGNRSRPESAGESIAATYTDKLRQEVAQLRRSTSSEPLSATPISVGSPVSENRGSEGRLPTDRFSRNPQWPGATSGASRSTGEVIIGSAPTNVEEYNDRLRIPVGETVEPSLPPLSDPDDHLPDMPFNGYIWPTRGVLTSGFGWRWGRPHRGIDIAGPVGTPVVAAASGEVVSAGWNSGGYGNLVKLRHADGSITFYAHNSRLLVRRGETVDQGQPIAEMGSTGFSTGPHLHFEVHPDGKGAVNPIAFLPRR